MADYKDLIEAAIQREIEIMGEGSALKIARSVDGLEVDDEGKVSSMSGEGKEKLKNLVDGYSDFTPVAKSMIKRKIDPMFDENPKLEKPENLL